MFIFFFFFFFYLLFFFLFFFFFFKKETLKNNNYEWSNIILMTVYIKNMSEFGKVNAIYKEYFSINPPPRFVLIIYDKK